MYLKRLELIGFKTFADKTELEFGPGITCIVGPNGSGKSNITDAIRWVLGEQSVKTLRGAKMEEVIFAGTAGRKPLGMAEANIVFDNTDNYLPLEFSDISVTRRIFRQGETQYSINKSNCRLKDLHELFMGTGLGQGAFCIMSQSEIDMVLSSNSQDRRLILEETAGINKYRFRKKEVNRKLEQTNQNMLRLRDILHEVENQMKELSQQVERYKRYRKYEEKLADYEIRLIKMEIDEASESQKTLHTEKESLMEKITALDEKMKELENDREKAKRNSLELQTRLDKERKGQSLTL
ncbi:MAG: AAA family ATPase, partial [Firmicutes bacterium]|nr:AAA family ATPase [Bacillota bacterium]